MTFVVTEHGAHELANRLWNDLSIHAYAYEVGARVINVTYLEHTRWGRWLHFILARLIDRCTRRKNNYWAGSSPKLLPPSVPRSQGAAHPGALFFFGWLFRNPVGMERYRTELLRTLTPSRHVRQKVDSVLAHHQGKLLIGVRLRQKPFKGFPNGEFLITPARMRDVTTEYLRERNIRQEDAAIIEVSDTEDELFGLHLLSLCTVVIGDNSTYSNLAAWMGNVPHIVATDEPIDWDYYRARVTYFDNKYATFSHGSLLYP